METQAQRIAMFLARCAIVSPTEVHAVWLGSTRMRCCSVESVPGMVRPVGAQVFVARVTLDVWQGLGYGTGGLDSVHVFTNGANLRLVERLPPPRPQPVPPGWRVIRPGECVLESLEPQDASGVIGRFLIDLPANKALRIIWETDDAGDYVFNLWRPYACCRELGEFLFSIDF